MTADSELSYPLAVIATTRPEGSSAVLARDLPMKK